MGRSIRTMLMGAALSMACHSNPPRLASGPAPSRSSADCAGVVAPVRGDSDFKQLKPPLLNLPLRGPLFPASPPYPPPGAEVRVNASGVVDSVVVDGTASIMQEQSLRRALLRSKAKPALFKGCPVTAWTVYVGTK